MTENRQTSETPLSQPYPSTRYQGSKRKILPWIYQAVKDLRFGSVLDLFGGTGLVSYLFKRMGKDVTYNDYLRFNYLTGVALIENADCKLLPKDVEFILTDIHGINYPSFVEQTFEGFFFTTEEDRWIDRRTTNVRLLDNFYAGEELFFKQALAYYAVFQTCLIKRPFNLFHRKNLYMRLNDVKRSFGNATTWAGPMDYYFERFSEEVNSSVFSNGRNNHAICEDAHLIEPNNYDLVYIDPPYFSNRKSMVACDYCHMYHFLEGIARYEEWPSLIDHNSGILSLRDGYPTWGEKLDLWKHFARLFETHRQSIIIVSYKEPGVPSVPELASLLTGLGKKVHIYKKAYKYALQSADEETVNYEVLIVAL